MSAVVTQSEHNQKRKKPARIVTLAQTWLCCCKVSEEDPKLPRGNQRLFLQNSSDASGVPHGDGLSPTQNILYHWGFVFLSRPHFGATFRKTVGLYYTAVLSPRYIFILEMLQLLLHFFMSAANLC